MKKSKNLKVMGIFGAAAVVVLGLSVGLGVGLTRGGSGTSNNSGGSPATPLEPGDSDFQNLDFSIQDVNSDVKAVLAINLSDVDQSNFADFSYLLDDSAGSLTLSTSPETVSFDFETGSSNAVYNGFGDPGTQRFYVPIIEDSSETTSYLVLQMATGDNNVNSFLYVLGIGSFTSVTNVFNLSFSALNLTNNANDLKLDLAFHVENVDVVPVPFPLTENLNFTRQDINNQLNGVLAFNLNNVDTAYFGRLAYVANADPSSVTLTKNTNNEKIDFAISTLEDDKVLNGFGTNEHLYLPIVETGSSATTYLELETAVSDSGNIQYLYVDAVGDFDTTTNIFKKTFNADDLISDQQGLDLVLSTDATVGDVPQPETPDTSPFDFTFTDFGGDRGYLLSTIISDPSDFDLSNFLYLSSSSGVNITYQNASESIDIEALTGSTNRGFFENNNLYIPISPATIGTSLILYDYIIFSMTSLSSSNDDYIVNYTVYSSESNVRKVFLNSTNTDFATNLIFTVGN